MTKKFIALFVGLLMVVTLAQPAFSVTPISTLGAITRNSVGGRMFIYEERTATESGLAAATLAYLVPTLAGFLGLPTWANIVIGLATAVSSYGYDQLFLLKRYYLLEDTGYATGEVDVFVYSNSDYTGLVRSYTESWYTGTPAQD